MDAATEAPGGGPRNVRGWLRVDSGGAIEGVNASLAELVGPGGPAGLIGVAATSLIAPSSRGALEAIGGAARHERGWRGKLELALGAGGLAATVDAEPRGLGGFELRLVISVPGDAAGAVERDAAAPVAEPIESDAPARSDEASEDAVTTSEVASVEARGASDDVVFELVFELVGEVAHELGNPLAAIAGYAEGLASLPADEQRRALAVIETEAARAGRVLRVLQAFAQSETRPASTDGPAASLRRLFAEARLDGGPGDQPSAPAAARPRILVVDDEESIRTLTTGVLQAGGYEAVGAASGEEALALLDVRGFDAVITDIRMPGMTGVALHGEIAQRWPDLARRVVIVSGDVQTEAVTALAREFELPALEKPFRLDALRAALSMVLERRSAEPEASER